MRHLLLAVVAGLAYLGGGLGRACSRAAMTPRCQGFSHVPVVVASRDLPVGAVLALDDLSQRSVPEAFVTADAVKPDAAQAVLGQRLVRSLRAGDALSWHSLETALDSTVAKRARAMPVVMDVGYALHADDHVDVLAVGDDPGGPWATTLLENVRLLRVDRAAGGATARRLWLLVLPEEAALLALAETRGQLRVAVRGVEDPSVIGPRSRTSLSSLLPREAGGR